MVAVEIDLVGAGSNPCPPLGAFAPDIDYNGTISIDFRAATSAISGTARSVSSLRDVRDGIYIRCTNAGNSFV
jgi:hypothetical protein